MANLLADKKSEKRILPRYTFEARVRITYRQNGKEIATEAWARDLSEGGLCAFMAGDLAMGEHVTIELSLGPSKEFTIPAKVARRLGTQYGFQFLAVSVQQRADILSAVQGKPSPE